MGGPDRLSGRWTIVALAGLVVLAMAPGAQAAVTGKANTEAMDLALAMESLPGLVTGASFPEYANGYTAIVPPSCTSTSGLPAAVSDAAITAAFGVPATPDFAILSTGDAREAATPSGCSNFGYASGAKGALDVTILQVDVTVPPTHNCLSFDFQFLSEEFPEWVGDVYNDAFIAELDVNTWMVTGATINAPDNFAFDVGGNPITINAASMTAGNAGGTPYDGGTDLLNAMTPVTPGAHSVYFSIFDVSDRALDSVVFLDDLFTFNATSGFCVPGAKPPAEPPLVALGSVVDADRCPGDPIPIMAAITWGAPGKPAWVDWGFGDGATQKDDVSGTSASTASTSHAYVAPGSYPVDVTVTDTNGLIGTASTWIFIGDCTERNDPPVIDPVPVQHVKAGTLVRFKVSGHDPDGDDVVFSAPKLPQAGMAFDPSSLLFTWTAGESGVYSATFRITEVTPFAQYDETNATIIVDPPPVAPETGDGDHDGAADGQDNCPYLHNPDQVDSDGDGVGDACDATPGTADPEGGGQDGDDGPEPSGDTGLGRVGVRDADRDGVTDGADNCPSVPNGDQVDRDRDGVGDLCDPDLDGDGVPQSDALGAFLDNCPFTVNAGQEDRDLDGIGDACQGDRDADGVPDGLDNCLWMPNPAQVDADGDGQGDACQGLGATLLPPGGPRQASPLATGPGAGPPGQATLPAWPLLAGGLLALAVLVGSVLLLARRRGEGA